MVARADSLTLYQPYGLGRGTVETFFLPAPSAGNNLVRTTAQGYWERYLTLFFVLTTSANAANRQVALEFQTADLVVFGGVAAGVVQAASLITRYYFGVGEGVAGPSAGLNQSAGFPTLFFQPGWRLVSRITLLDASDAITGIGGLVERFGIGPDGTPVGETADQYTERGRGYGRTLESE